MIVSFLGDEVSFKVKENKEGKYPQGLFILENHGNASLRTILRVHVFFHY